MENGDAILWKNGLQLSGKKACKKQTTKIEGNNPDIFTYRFGEEDEVGCQMLIMTFYRTLEVFISLITPKAIKIRNLRNLKQF